MKLRDIFLALLVVFIWGTNFSFIKIGLEELPPILFSALRFAIVAIPAILFIPFPKTSVWNVVGVGIFLGVLKFSFLFVAMKSDASAGLSSLILQSQVFFTIGLSVLFFKESVNKIQLLGMIVAVIGFVFFFFNTGSNITITGLVLILFAALFWAVSNLIMKQIKQVNLFHFMAWVCLIPPIPLLLLSFFTETNSPIIVILSTSITTWWALFFSGYISTLVAFAIWGFLLKNYSAASVTPFALLIPVVGISVSSFLLNENLKEIIGTSLVMLGLVVCVAGKKLLTIFLKPGCEKNN